MIVDLAQNARSYEWRGVIVAEKWRDVSDFFVNECYYIAVTRSPTRLIVFQNVSFLEIPYTGSSLAIVSL